jgi:hypothetical protein
MNSNVISTPSQPLVTLWLLTYNSRQHIHHLYLNYDLIIISTAKAATACTVAWISPDGSLGITDASIVANRIKIASPTAVHAE